MESDNEESKEMVDTSTKKKPSKKKNMDPTEIPVVGQKRLR